MIEIIKYPETRQWNKLLRRPYLDLDMPEEKAADILSRVRSEGDTAVKAYTEQFDGAALSTLQVDRKDIEEASSSVDGTLKQAIALAADNIKTFHAAQRSDTTVVETMAGVRCWQKAVPVEKVGLYVPGGTAPLFSTVLMLAIPAQIAGCKEIVMCTPPGPQGDIHPAVLYAASLIPEMQVFRVGGVQAIAAMAYGTQSIPAVYKIFGPGNRYVTAAKQLVSRDGIAIDMPAGPSEVAVLADASANPSFVAADMLSQAEHGNDSQAILITTEEKIIQQVTENMKQQIAELPRKEYAYQSMRHSKIILVKDEEEMVAMANAYAPEHLILSVKNYIEMAEHIVHAGSVFLGNHTPESAGDYASGTNHTLPTYGYARSYSGVNLDSFLRKVTFQELTPQGVKNIGPAVEAMAEAEELTAHKNAMTLRLKNV